MIFRLVWRSLRFAPGRSLLMLGGYALGVGVMVALLSIGDAMVAQSRDRDLVGGGDLAVLPAGIDLETLRTGGVSSLYFDIDLARFYQRDVLTGPRLAGSVEAAAPWLDDELLYARLGDSTWAISAGGQIPSAAAALGVAPDIRSGDWVDVGGGPALDRPDRGRAPGRRGCVPRAAAREAAGDSIVGGVALLQHPLSGRGAVALPDLPGGRRPARRRVGRPAARHLGDCRSGRALERVFERTVPAGDRPVRAGGVDVAIGPNSRVAAGGRRLLPDRHDPRGGRRRRADGRPSRRPAP